LSSGDRSVGQVTHQNDASGSRRPHTHPKHGPGDDALGGLELGSSVRSPAKLTLASVMVRPYLLPGRAVCHALGPGGRWTLRSRDRPSIMVTLRCCGAAIADADRPRGATSRTSWSDAWRNGAITCYGGCSSPGSALWSARTVAVGPVRPAARGGEDRAHRAGTQAGAEPRRLAFHPVGVKCSIGGGGVWWRRELIWARGALARGDGSHGVERVQAGRGVPGGDRADDE
jgi:hypothetical protein